MLTLQLDIFNDEVTAGISYSGEKGLSLLCYAISNSDNATSVEEKIKKVLTDIKTNGIKSILGTLPHSHDKKIEKVTVWLNAPNIFIQTKRVGLEQEKPFIVKEEHLLKIKKQAGDAFKEDHKGLVYEQTEEEISSIMIDGYVTHIPLKKSAHHLSLTLYQSFVESEYLKKIKEDVKSFSGVANVECKARIHAYAKVGYSLVQPPEDFMVIDVSDKSTELVIVRKDGHIAAGHSLSGKEAIIQKVCEISKTSTDAAQSLLELHTQKTLDERINKDVLEAVEKAKKMWLDDFGQLVSTISNGQTIPHRIVFVKETLGTLFTDWIMSDEFSSMYTASNDHTLIELNPTLLKSFATIKEGISISESASSRLLVEVVASQ